MIADLDSAVETMSRPLIDVVGGNQRLADVYGLGIWPMVRPTASPTQ